MDKLAAKDWTAGRERIYLTNKVSLLSKEDSIYKIKNSNNYIELNLSAPDQLLFIEKILDEYGFDSKDFKLFVER
jgi:hypothetical protein